MERFDGRLVRLVGVLALGGMMEALDVTIVNVSIRAMASSLGAPLSAIAWVSIGYLLAFAMAVPVSGWSIDRFGGRRVWLIALGGFVLASAGSGAAWSVGSLIAFRVLQGLAGGMLAPSMLTLVARAAGPDRSGRALGLASAPITLGPVLGPVAGGIIVAHLPWPWIFLINIPIGAVAWILAYRVVPRDRPGGEERRSLDGPGLVLVSIGFAAVTYGLSQAGGAGFTAAPVVAALAFGVLLLAGYVWHAGRVREPLIDLRLFANPGYAASVAVMALAGVLVIGPMFLLPLYFQRVHTSGVLAAGLLLAPLGAGAFLGMPLAGRLADRYGPRRLVPFGALVAGLAMLAYARADAATGEPVLAACLLAYGIGLGFVGPPTMAAAYRTVPSAAAGSATGTLYILNQAFASLGLAMITLQLQAPGALPGSRSAFWFLTATAAVILAIATILPGRPTAAAGTPQPAETTPAQR